MMLIGIPDDDSHLKSTRRIIQLKKTIMNRLIILVLALSTIVVQAQSFDDLLQNYVGSNKESYLQPLPDLMAGTFHSGWNVGGKIDSGLYFRIGISSMVGYVSDNLRTFSATTEYPFEPLTKADVPTIVGSNEAVVVDGVNGTQYVFQGGRDVVLFPMALPQLTIGGLYGTELSIRFVAYDFKGDFGKLTLFGAGVKHDIGQYLNLKNWFWTGGYAMQLVKGGYYFDYLSHYIHTEAGQSGKNAYYFGTIGFQTASLDARYHEDPDQGNREVTLALKNDFPIFIGIGGGLKWGKLRIHAAVHYAKAPFGEFGMHIQF